jgi:hypothetical protein
VTPLKGDSNTKYFHLIENKQYRKTHIFQLEDGNQIIKGDDQLKEYITKYYHGLFGPSDCDDFYLIESQYDGMPQVFSEENGKFTTKFSEKEVKDAIFHMKHNKVLEPDNLLARVLPGFLGSY